MIIENERLDEAVRFVRMITEGKYPSDSGRSMRSSPQGRIGGAADAGGMTDRRILDDPAMLRNMFFIYGILNELRNGGLVSSTPDPFPYEILDRFCYKKDKGIRTLIRQIYSPISSANVDMLTPQAAGCWLRDHGYISDEYDPETHMRTAVPTESGKQLGLYSQAREYQGRRFYQIYYSRSAQEFIVEHFREILEYRRKQ